MAEEEKSKKDMIIDQQASDLISLRNALDALQQREPFLELDEAKREIFEARNEFQALQVKWQKEKRRADESSQRCTFYSEDVVRLNELLNEAAEENDLCESFENVLMNANEQLKLIRMEGRKRKWQVRVYMNVIVDATSAEVAEELAEEVAGEIQTSDWVSFVKGFDSIENIENDSRYTEAVND